MNKTPDSILKRLHLRQANDSLRSLSLSMDMVDFSSNDYLGLSRNEEVMKKVSVQTANSTLHANGSTGSRLINGNSLLIEETEKYIASFFNVEEALIFNSGFNANLALLMDIPTRSDVILYDELIHASIRDGLKGSHAKSYKFKHNDFNDLNQKMERFSGKGDCYVVTESVFSMNGDSPDMNALIEMCRNRAYLIVDEAHGVGVQGQAGKGLLYDQSHRDEVFATVVTFGKALGCHGATILGSHKLKTFLINYARSFIYTTAMSPHSISTIQQCFKYLDNTPSLVEELVYKISYFVSGIQKNGLQSYFSPSKSAIQSCIIPGVSIAKNISSKLRKDGFDVKAILSPTVPAGQERLRFCVHNYNSEDEIDLVLKKLNGYLK